MLKHKPTCEPLKAKTQKEIKESKRCYLLVLQTCREILPGKFLQCFRSDRSDQVNKEAVNIFGLACACRTSRAALIRSNLARAEDVRKLQGAQFSLNPGK